MRAIWIIAKNTFKEIIRDRILYGILVSAVLLILLSLALGQLSFAEQTRIATNFGFTAIHLGAMIVSIFVGSTLVGREIEKKTIMTLFVRPINREQFLIGKCLGLMGVNLVCISGLACILLLILFSMELPVSLAFFAGIYGIVLEATLLLAIAILFGCFSSPMLSVSFTIGFFLIGHWIESLKFFLSRAESPTFYIVGKGLTATLPNFEFFNWRSLFVYDDPIPWSELGFSSIYMLAWLIFLITISALILGRRDLV
jgi:Cu-processing system permease protein